MENEDKIIDALGQAAAYISETCKRYEIFVVYGGRVIVVNGSPEGVSFWRYAQVDPFTFGAPVGGKE